jgi:hypothetical protein
MPGDANAAERGRLRVLIIGLVFTQTFSPAGAAAGGQSQSQIPVSAYVVVSSSITATVSAAIAPSAPPPQTAPSSAAASSPASQDASQAPQSRSQKPSQICAEVAVSCSGRAPMRLSVDDGESATEAQECAAAGPQQAQNTISLCATGANGPQDSLGLNIEY